MRTIYTICIALVLVATVACSKEKKLNNRLNGNTWNIDKIEWVKTETSISGFGYAEGTTNNAGTFTFEESTGTSTMTIDDETEDNASFSWDVASDGSQLDMTYDLTIVGTTVNQRTMVIEENKSKKQMWVLTEQRVDGAAGTTYQLVAEITLSR